MSESRFESAVVVLGMPGSRASVLAEILRTCNPRAFGPPRGHAATGPSEAPSSAVIASLHESILEEMAPNWRTIHPIDEASVYNGARQRRQAEICRAVVTEFSAGKMPLIDDTRVCRLLPLWTGALAQLAEVTHFPIVFGDPVEVAQASCGCGNKAVDDPLMRWARYYLDAEHATRGKSRLFILHSDLRRDWRSALRPLFERLRLPIDDYTVDYAPIEHLLSSPHLDGQPRDGAVWQSAAAALVDEIFGVLQRWANEGQESEADHGSLDEARRQLDELSREYPGDAGTSGGSRQIGDIPSLLEFQNEFARLHAALEDRARLDRALADALDEARNLRGQLASAQEEARGEARLQSQLIQVRDDELTAVEANLQAVSDELKSVKEKYRSTQAILARERQILKELRANLARSEIELAAFRNSIGWRLYVRFARSLARLRRTAALITGSRSPKRRERVLALIEQSNLFDRDWYLQTYPDVATSGVDPIVHYLDNGWREGRNPGPGFCTSAYLKANADVAAHGFNPLVHYVEYGHSEGRGAPELAEPSTRPSQMRKDFGPAAPCASFPVPQARVPRWQRAADLDLESADVLRISGGLAIGRVADKGQEQILRAALEQLAFLSGARTASQAGERMTQAAGRVALVDMWFAASNRLRGRWRPSAGEGAMVVRVLQHGLDDVEMVGEALVADELDVVDAKLVNPFFPLLFIFSDVDGLILGTQMLAFPSLCRGGRHYAEFTAVQKKAGSEVDLCQVSAGLADQLLAIRHGSGDALVSNIAVNLSGAVGTASMFQGDFQHWLTKVAAISVRPIAAEAADGPQKHLAAAVTVDGGEVRASTGGQLILASDMVPSIAALCTRAERSGPDAGPLVTSLVLSLPDPSQPAVLCQVPVDVPGGGHASYPPTYPFFAPRQGFRPRADIAVLALRDGGARGLSDAELLTPLSEPLLDVREAAGSISWLFQPADWDEGELLESLEALGAQVCCRPASVLFLGAAPSAAAELAERLFASNVKSITRPDELGAALESQFVGYVGAGVVLHDRRTAAVLAQLLEDPDHISASAALVAVAQRGKGVVVTPADLGTITESREAPSAALLASAASLLWRSSWPSMAPPRDLWLTRSAEIAAWMSDPRADCGDRVHACTAMVSASYRGARGSSDAAIVPPAAAIDHCLKIELVVG